MIATRMPWSVCSIMPPPVRLLIGFPFESAGKLWRGLFRPRPIGNSSDVASVVASDPIPEPERNSKIESMLKSRFGKKETVVRLHPIFDAEDEVKGYFAYTRSQ